MPAIVLIPALCVIVLALGAAPASAAPQSASVERVAFDSTAASSSARRAGPGRAADGRRATGWRARRSGRWHWQGRLRRAERMARLRVYVPRRVRRVVVSTSMDGKRFRKVRTVTLRGKRWTRIDLRGRRARVVRLSMRSRRAPRGRLREVRLDVRRAVKAPSTQAVSAAPTPLAPPPVAQIPPAVPTAVPPAPPSSAPVAAPDPGPQPPGPDPEPVCEPRLAPGQEPVQLPAPSVARGVPDTSAAPAGPAPAPAPQDVDGDGEVDPFAGVVTDPIDERHLRQLPFGTRSHWLQPWRAFLDTPPAGQLRQAVGINLNALPAEAHPVARLLAANGFRRARIEIAWGEMHVADETAFRFRENVMRKLCAARDAGLRPLILLNTDSGWPGPAESITLELAEAASTDDQTVRLTAASAEKVAQRERFKTGLDGKPVAAKYLITDVDVDTGLATLSRPLDEDLEAGEHAATTLRYLPFSPLTYPGGEPNPYAEETLAGWLRYVESVTGLVTSVLGTTGFDVEVSNEQNLNAEFYDVDEYFEPDRFPTDPGAPTNRVENGQEILRRTVDWIKDPAHGLGGVRVGNGFASQRPWDSAATSPPGLDAIDKHYYPDNTTSPGTVAPGNAPVDALGAPTSEVPFSPSYTSFFPEQSLTGIKTETIVRDIGPITTNFLGPFGAAWDHGRDVLKPDGEPVSHWMTEIGLDTDWAQGPLGPLSDDDVEHLRAKATLRTLVSYVNKGMTQVDFYAAATASWSLIGADFWDAWHDTRRYPGDGAGGPTMDGVRRLVASLGDEEVTAARALSLASIADYAGRAQFAGDGSERHPTLFDRDVLAFLPFQASDDRFVIPVYVMTRDMAEVHDPASPSDPRRLDLPDERFQLTIGGTRAATARVHATDPLTGQAVPAEIVRRTDEGWLVVEMAVTDSPRLLVIEDG